MAEGLRNVNDNGEIDLWKIIPTLKKYLPRWIMSAVILGFLSLGYAEVYTHINKPELKSLVGFTYDGIEKGLDPSGRKFDINSLKSPEVIEMALSETNTDLKKLEDVRNGISFEKIIPASAYDKFTVYNSILKKG
ncbi:MAG: lipopolysaccharide biosynthesis protein, partial [Oscillospiraceae bacterium]|nr:lipopolysaccharide biosynthesis protein [Oscillospiraceae bacterium]